MKYPAFDILKQGENSKVSFLSEETESKYTFPGCNSNQMIVQTMMGANCQIHAFTICCGIMDDAYKSKGFIGAPINTDETMKNRLCNVKNAQLSPR